jgi:hypothetical protein
VKKLVCLFYFVARQQVRLDRWVMIVLMMRKRRRRRRRRSISGWKDGMRMRHGHSSHHRHRGGEMRWGRKT